MTWLLVAAPGVHAQAAKASAQALLERMTSAFLQEDYDGIFTYFNGDQLASLRVVHKVVDGQQRERLLHLDGAPREIVRKGEEVVCIVMPEDDIAVLEQSIPKGPFARAFVREFDRLTNVYRVQHMGEGRVANRKAVRLAVAPLDRHRYGYQLYLDAETSLLLRSDVVDSRGNSLETFQFNHIQIGNVDDAALEPSDMSGSMVSHLTLKGRDHLPAPAPKQQPRVRWQLGWQPAGFRMAMQDLRTKPSSELVDSLIYSDGLATFTIFVERMPRSGAASMTSSSGATVAITRGIKAEGQGFLATLVGEIPSKTGRKIIESLQAEE
ncbi:MAG: MucB/RseB C-terminal domain-containing protein [Pseudomonadota bacterium]